ncbi:PH domain-containing protein [Nocardioides sp.]|uniref:PH domain-containing protein n=1 Tax=Nocardioides sp. TaxID=35761 RepID=UPI0035275A6B
MSLPPDPAPPPGAPVEELPPPQGSPVGGLPPPAEVDRAVVPPGAVEPEWQRLDPRMLLVGPLGSLRQFALPLIVALFGLSSSAGGLQVWMIGPAVAIPVLLGLLPWLTTRFKMTGSQFVRRSGLLNKKQVTAPLDRVRSVDLESSLLHRLLGLTKVQIGTGVDDTRIELNALSTDQAAALRAALLGRREAGPEVAPGGGSHVAREGDDCAETAVDGGGLPTFVPKRQHSETPAPPHQLARIDWSWLKFAPFSLSRLAVVAGVFGVVSQFADSLPFLDQEHLDSGWHWATSWGLPLLGAGVATVALVAWLAISVTGYVIQWWDLSLTRERGSLHLTSGLFTTRSVTVEEARVRGVELTEPLLLRLVDGAELATLATGVGSGGTTKVLPPCPRAVCEQVGHEVLGADDALTRPLTRHDHWARRRQHVRAQWPALFAVAGILTLTVSFDWPGWVPVVALLAFPGAALAAEASYRHLGHLLTPTHLAAGAPAVARRRTVLERDGVIGWVVQQSFFQRRRGLATLVATTAAGGERVVVTDLPLPHAVALVAEVTPEPVAPFLA